MHGQIVDRQKRADNYTRHFSAKLVDKLASVPGPESQPTPAEQLFPDPEYTSTLYFIRSSLLHGVKRVRLGSIPLEYIARLQQDLTPEELACVEFPDERIKPAT